ncbi:hypothetical protein KQI86_13030 [Clostridium sp. MSJ-11]|uniref:Uncharacterized protein n=1 Tax=Clostridium mobile TaxID=2841512 RepID=A0ABS6ELD3_9CLOT|nr:hypothetical protein [Clostridium mobile]MBU5485260.1 hypothetical protein [Clostridium mobile]
MKTTINYGLKKPEGTDVVNIEDLNYNADIIDQKIKEVDTKASNIKVPVTSVNGKTGAVTLAAIDIGAVPTGRKINSKPLSVDIALSASDIKTSSGATVESQLAQIKTDIGSETLQTTKKNLKGAINEVFQFANEGKKSISTAVTAKGVPASPSDTFPTLANKIGQIETGYGVGKKIPASSLQFNFGVLWDFTVTNNILSPVGKVISDSENNTYTYDARESKVVKISPSGTLLWEYYGFVGAIHDIAIDKYNNVYACGNDRTIRKISSLGEEIWKLSITGMPSVLTVAPNGRVYVDEAYGDVVRINSDGSGKVTMTIHSNKAIASIDVDSDNNIYTCANYSVKKNKDSILIWEYTNKTYAYYLAVDSNNCCYIMGDILTKLKVDGVKDWDYSGFKERPNCLTLDKESNVYTNNGYYNIKKLTSNGVALMDFEIPYDRPIRAIDVDTLGNLAISARNTIFKLEQSYTVLN